MTSCVAPLSALKARPPIPPSENLPTTESIKEFRVLWRHDLLAASGRLLDGLKISSQRIAAGDDSAIPTYNYLVGRFIEIIEEADGVPWNGPVSIPGRDVTYTLHGSQPDDLHALERRLVPADTLKFIGKYAEPKVIKEGIGAPVVAIVSQPPTPYETFDDATRYRTVTALIRFRGRRVTLDLEDPFADESVRFAGRNLSLAADYGSNVSLHLSEQRIDKLALARLLLPARYDETANLTRIQPYDPDRIPVVFVHGLIDTPATFVSMYLVLMRDPEIRHHYQFWSFSYPSGYPHSYSASLLRNELDRANRAYPGHKGMVMIGHSMGGLLTRLMITDTGDRIWLSYFGTLPGETAVSGNDRKVLEDALIFESRPDVSRVVFIATPHRGSELAGNWVGRASTRLVKLSSTIADVRDSVANIRTEGPSITMLERSPSGIDTLSPKNRFIIDANKIPIDSRVPYHSIIGDLGKGDTPDSSDGVVAYRSSHLEGAASEKIIPSNHFTNQKPECIAEVRRILRLHAGLPPVAADEPEAPQE